MKLKLIISLHASGTGAKSANAEAQNYIDDIPGLVEETLSDWVEDFQGNHDEPDIEWSVNCKVVSEKTTRTGA